MGLLNKVGSALGDAALGASNVGTIASVAKGVGSLLGFGKNQQQQQMEQQKQLMAYQNELNQKNSLLDYERQRQLTKDNALLQKVGLQQAGINTAFGDGSSVASAASVGSTSPTSTPSALPTQSSIDSQYSQMMNSSSSALSQFAINRSQINLINEQAENMRQRNLTQLQRDLVSMLKERSEAKSIEQRNQYDKIIFDAEKQYAAMNARNKAWSLENDSLMKHINATYFTDMTVADLQNKRQDYLNKLEDNALKKQERAFYKYKVAAIESQIEETKAKTQDALSHVGVNDATVENLNANTEGKNIQNDFDSRSFQDRLDTIKKGSVPDNLYQKIQIWHKDGTFEKLNGFQQLGYSLYEALIATGVKPSDATQLAKLAILKK